MKRILVIVLLLSLLCGCANPSPDYTLDAPDPAASTTSRQPAPTWIGLWRDYATYPVERPSGSALGNKYYYTTGKLVSYYDFELERMIVPCSQPNCVHSDETCSAYISGVQSVLYQMDGDVAYAITSDSRDGGKASLLSLNPVTGSRKVLMDLSPEQGRYRENFALCIDGGTVFVQFQDYASKNGKCVDAVNYAYAVDRTTGEAELLLREPVPEAVDIALNGTYLVLEATTERFLLIARQGNWKEEPIPREEYIAQGHTVEEYLAYLHSILPETFHYSLDRQTGQETRIFGSDSNARIQDASAYREKKVSFVDGDTLCIYDGYTGQVTEYFREANIGMQSYLDGRIIYNVCHEANGTKGYDYFWYDLTTGEKKQFQEGVQSMVFSVIAETMDYLIGIYNGLPGFLFKQDFYNENYGATKWF